MQSTTHNPINYCAIRFCSMWAHIPSRLNTRSGPTSMRKNLHSRNNLSIISFAHLLNPLTTVPTDTCILGWLTPKTPQLLLQYFTSSPPLKLFLADDFVNDGSSCIKQTLNPNSPNQHHWSELIIRSEKKNRTEKLYAQKHNTPLKKKLKWKIKTILIRQIKMSCSIRTPGQIKAMQFSGQCINNAVQWTMHQ